MNGSANVPPTSISQLETALHPTDNPEIAVSDAFAQFMGVRTKLLARGVNAGVTDMDSTELKAHLATERLKNYEALP